MLLTLKRKNKKGFTLIELIVVVAILAILAAVAVPSFIGLQARAQQGVDISNASAIAGAINVFNSMQATNGTKIIAGDDYEAKLGDMWPVGVTAADKPFATARLSFTATYVATVDGKIYAHRDRTN